MTLETLFTHLYTQYQALVRSILVRGLLGDTLLAEDLSQEVWLRVWLALPAFQTGRNEKAWIGRITANCLLDYQRQQARRRKRVRLVNVDECYADGALVYDVCDEQAYTEEVVCSGDGIAAIWAAFATLPAQQQEVLRLTMRGYTGSEIAAHYGKSPTSNVGKNWKHLARKAFDKAYRRQEEEVA